MSARHRIAGGAATAVAVLMLAGPAMADGMGRSLKDAPAPQPEPRRCTLSANAALTTDYVFRGFSQTAGGPAVQGGFDATCGRFYFGVWGSSLDWDGLASMELDAYAGIKFTRDRFAFDLGVIYYSYPNNHNSFFGFSDPNYIELKAGATAQVWQGGTIGATAYWSPDYTFESGSTLTLEGSFSQSLRTMGRFTPTISALVGYQRGYDNDYIGAAIANGDNHYWYWNAGLTLGFDKNWSVDFRYWDTSLSNSGGFCDPGVTGPAGSNIFQCDQRYVATLKFTY